MDFLNVADLWRTLLLNRRKLPRDIDLVVGIPRSGMFPATMLATQLNLPMTDLDGLVANRILGHGSTKSAPDVERARAADRTVLVIDDTVGSGGAFRQARVALEGVPGKIVFCAVYAAVARHPDVDIVLKKVDHAPLCQWNLMHHAVLSNACVDMDGVLCRNPELHEDDDGKAYRTFLETAEKLHATSGEIGWLVTSRRARYRAETEAWLAKHDVRYRSLIMAETEDDHAQSPDYKARVYIQTGAELFIESEAEDAARIFELSQRPVLCIATQSMVAGTAGASGYRSRRTKRLTSSLATIKLTARRIFGNRLYYALKRLAGRG